MNKYPRAFNHFALNKYSGPQLGDWQHLLEVLREMIEGM